MTESPIATPVEPSEKYINIRGNKMLACTFLLILVILFILVVRSELPEYTQGIITLIIGRALGYIDQGFNFEFGTTRSSIKKDETINVLAKGP